MGAFSTTRPAYITAISSARPATTPRSWVTRIMPMKRSRCWNWSRSRIWACTVTSRAVVGSSAKSSLGPQASAMAIITRWRMPPESWWGYSFSRRAGSGMPTDLSRARATSLASCLEMSRCSWSDSVIWRPILRTGLRAVMGSWNTIAICWPQYGRMSLGDSWAMSAPSKRMRPSRTALGASSPMIERASTDLPDPDSPTMPRVLPRSRVKVMPATALTMPRSVWNEVRRSSISSSDPLPSGPGRSSRMGTVAVTARSP